MHKTKDQVLIHLMETATRTESGCLIATIGTSQEGYRRVMINYERTMAHRLAVEYATGRRVAPWPEESVDHLCHTGDPECMDGPLCPHRACVEPAHLEVVTPVENLSRTAGRRKINFCVRKHPQTTENRKPGGRGCRVCAREDMRAYRARQRTQ